MNNEADSTNQWKFQLTFWSPILVSIFVTKALGIPLLERLLITCGVGLIAVEVARAIFPFPKIR